MALKSFLFIMLLAGSFSAMSQDMMPLWPESKMPNSKGLIIKDSVNNERALAVGKPSMYAFFTSRQENKGAAVLIIPGGGYRHLAFNISGFQLAKWFNTMGIHAFVLIHRLPHSADIKEREKAPLQDAERAMKIIRKNAAQWGIDSTRVGVMGSSAGAHLAASLGTIQDNFSKIGDVYDDYSHRPDFMILVSPVIDMGNDGHKGSRENLLGTNPTEALVKKYSLQNQVSKYTPPAFLVHAYNDKSVSPKNSLMFYNALLSNNIPSSLHIFNQGGHSIALRNNPGGTGLWINLCEEWLIETGMLKALPK